MNKRLKRISVALAAMALGAGMAISVPVTASAAAPASSGSSSPAAYPSNCSTRIAGAGSPGFFIGQSKCTSGTGAFRSIVRCSFAGQTPGTHYGQYVAPGPSWNSTVQCPFMQDVVSVTVQRIS